MLMPEENPKTDLIMVATGTGIAPYRLYTSYYHVNAHKNVVFTTPLYTFLT